MRVEFTIDWLSYTAHLATVSMPSLLVPFHPMRAMFPLKPMYGYRESAQNGAGAIVMFTPENPTQGQHCVYGGTALNRYADVSITWYDIVFHHEKRGDVCRRVDLALDVHDSGLKIGVLHDELHFNPHITRLKKFSRITSNDGGDTLYVGARQSDAMLRIYDKAAEQQMLGNWKRIELELKQDKASAASRAIYERGASYAPTLAIQLMGALVAFASPTWREIMGEDTLKFSLAKESETDTETWLVEQVAPAMGRYLARCPDPQIPRRFWQVVRQYRKDPKSGSKR